jgi:hypothetical protein
MPSPAHRWPITPISSSLTASHALLFAALRISGLNPPLKHTERANVRLTGWSGREPHFRFVPFCGLGKALPQN